MKPHFIVTILLSVSGNEGAKSIAGLGKIVHAGIPVSLQDWCTSVLIILY